MSSSSLVTGVFRRAAGGHGFVRPLEAAAGDRTGDIHVAAHAQLDAASGDTVKVRVSRARDVRRPCRGKRSISTTRSRCLGSSGGI
ncbi:MAG: hypothetical protein ACKOEX_05010, partial [Planctomycetia bacterium]